MHTDDPQSIQDFRKETNIGYVDDSGPVLGEPDMGCILLNLVKPPFNDVRGSGRPFVWRSTSPPTRPPSTSVSTTPSTGVFTPGSPFKPATSSYPTYNPTQGEVPRQQLKAEGKTVNFTLGPPRTSIGAGRHIHPVRAPDRRDQRQHQVQQIQQAELINVALGRHVPGPALEAVRCGRPGPQLRVLEPDGDPRVPGHRHDQEQRPARGERPPAGTA